MNWKSVGREEVGTEHFQVYSSNVTIYIALAARAKRVPKVRRRYEKLSNVLK